MTGPERIRVLELRSVCGAGGGPEKTIVNGALRADLTRFEVVVCYIRDERDRDFAMDERARQMGIDYVEVTERHSLDTSIVGKLECVIRDRDIDIVHAHDHKTDLVTLWLSKKSRIIPLATAHGWTGQSARERYVYYPADRFALSRFPRVIAVSSEIKDRLVDSGAQADRVTVILNGIDPTRYARSSVDRERVRQALGFTERDYVVGSVGRVERQKRFDLLIDAMAPLMKSDEHLQLVVAGDGSLLDSLRSLASTHGIGPRCHLLGHRTDIADLHQAFDLFVQSSEYEGTPNAVLEAMAMETPLVATRAGGTAELALDGEHGRLVAIHDVDALRSAIQSVRADPSGAERRARAGRQRIETTLSFDGRTRHLERVYEELVRA